MGARQSKRSVDITTTPKKGDGEVVVEGEGKLEKIGDADIKTTTNGSLPHTDLDLADKDENAKDATAEKDTENKVPQENGVSESEEVKTPDEENSEEKLNESATVEEKTSDSTTENKIEETPETKKQKEKSKKKKWSFRSISFSKKDKSKPSKDSEKNGDVKEVAEENAEENATSPSIESPKDDDAKVPEAVTNGDASTADISKPIDNPPTADEPAKPAEEQTAEETKPAAAEEPKVPEPVVEKPAESAPSPIKEQEESKPVEPPTPVVEETKEVRSEEIPPPLPSTNPPSQVTVFAESTKADSLTADQVPSLPQSVPVVETIPEPSVVQSVLESKPLAASSPVVKNINEKIEVVESKVESVVSEQDKEILIQTQESGLNSESALPKTLECEIELPHPKETPSESPKTSETESLVPTKLDEISAELPKLSPIEKTPESAVEPSEEIPSEPISKQLQEPEPPCELPEDSVKISETKSITPESLLQEDKLVEDVKSTEITECTMSPKSTDPLEKPLDTSASTDVPTKVSEHEVTKEDTEVLVEDSPRDSEISVEINKTLEVEEASEKPQSPVEPDVSSTDPKSVEEVIKETKTETVLVEAIKDIDLAVPAEQSSVPLQAEDLPEPPKSPVALPSSPSLTEVVDESFAAVSENIIEPLVPSPESQSPTIEQLPESVVNPADSLPDISTESLPSLPEPVSDNLAEPMSLPPVDSVPEPIATDCPISEIPLPADSIVLTNGNTNGLPSSPTDEVSALPLKEGPLKQVPSAEISNETRQEEGDQKTVAPVEAAAVEE